MIVFTELNALLAAHGFGTASAVKHVAESLREAGLIQDGRRTPMTAQDAVALMLGMSTRGAGREKVFNVEALLAMRLQLASKPLTFGEALAARLETLGDTVQVTVSIAPDQPSATIITEPSMPYPARDGTRMLDLFIPANPRPIGGVHWTVEIHHRTMLAIAQALR